MTYSVLKLLKILSLPKTNRYYTYLGLQKNLYSQNTVIKNETRPTINIAVSLLPAISQDRADRTFSGEPKIVVCDNLRKKSEERKHNLHGENISLGFIEAVNQW